jgi:hypothetical protein
MNIWTELLDAGVDTDLISRTPDGIYRVFDANDELVASFGHATTETGDSTYENGDPIEGWDFHHEDTDCDEWREHLSELVALVVEVQS